MRNFEHPSPDPVDVEIGARIKRYRQARHLPLSVVGEAAGVSFQQIQKYEAGLNRIAAATLVRIAACLGVSAAYLMGESLDAGVDPETVALLRTPGAFALLEAYADIRTQSARAALIQLAEAAAQPGSAAPSRSSREPPLPLFEAKSFMAE